MGFLNPGELTKETVKNGVKKAGYPAWKMLLLGIFAGVLLAFAAAVTSTAGHAVQNAGLRRLISGLLFPFGLCAILALGAELFTGGSLIAISVLEKKVPVRNMLKSWLFVYIGNMIGGFLVAAGNVYGGQLEYSGGQLAVYTIKTAVGKCEIGFGQAVVLGIFCNVLVCAGVLMSTAGKDFGGRMIGAYIPVSLFVICGFEHSVANMYYIPAGLLANMVPAYAQKAAEMGIDTTMLTWGNFFGSNLLPVTIGNLIGGVGLACLMWVANRPALKEEGGLKL